MGALYCQRFWRSIPRQRGHAVVISHVSRSTRGSAVMSSILSQSTTLSPARDRHVIPPAISDDQATVSLASGVINGINVAISIPGS